MSGSLNDRPSGAFTLMLLLAVFAFAAGCSNANTSGGVDGSAMNHVDPSGQSVPGWLVLPAGGAHAPSAVRNYIANGDSSACAECHGADLSGGISRVSCFGNVAGCHHGAATGWVAASPAVQGHGASAKRAPGNSGFASCQICHGRDYSGGGAQTPCSECHTGGAPHPAAPWVGSPYTHTNTDTANVPVCAQCHTAGSANNPTGFPPDPAPAGTAPGCFNSTLCHGSAVAPHAAPYNDSSHYGVTASTFTGSCATCHDVSAPTAKSGPVCVTCHQAASPLTALNCTSCHADPPNGSAPAGAAYPNIAGAHSGHAALNAAGSPVSCDTCHNGLGSGTLAHYNAAVSRTAPGNVAFSATYNAKTGASSFDNSAALTCSNVSCHGGQTTPNWRTGSIDVNNQCTVCHASGTAQYNSYNSGEHSLHITEFGASATTCKYCHNTATLAVSHFTALNTQAMEGPASATIGGTGTLVTTYVPSTGSCSPRTGVCHGTETW
jgi:predicted CxxxxCH...CXXCH cytochrome family protein